MISSCCTFRLNRRSALSMDSPSCTFTSAKLDYTPFAATAHRSHGPTCCSVWPLDPSEYVRLSQVNADPRRKAELASIDVVPLTTPQLLTHSAACRVASHESSHRRRRRPRACAGLAARARARRVDGDRLRAGKRRACRASRALVAVDAADPDALLALAERERIDLTVVGPELPLDRGVVDRFRADGRRIFGPTARRRAARVQQGRSRRTSWRGTAFRRRAIASATPRADARAVIASRRVRFPGRASRPTASPRERRRRRGGSRGSGARDPRGDGRAAVRRRRRAARDRGMPRSVRRSRSSRCATARARYR